jgi:superfamily II DNA or RNA helicase
VAQLEAENRRLRELLGMIDDSSPPPISAWEPTLFGSTTKPTASSVNRRSSPEEKMALFRSLFRGRGDVFAVRWENPRSAKSGWSPAVKGGWANSRNPNREYLPLDDEVVGRHLSGGCHVGLYPLLDDDSCWVLAADFDGTTWAPDALAYLDSASSVGLPSALERSRSGDGAHVWAFFADPVPASVARRIGVYLVREAMTVRAEMDLASYDRLFPSQDFLPRQGFGNLIALPLQGECRKKATTVFLDPKSLQPFPDQWEFLSSLPRMSGRAAHALAEGCADLAVGPGGATYRKPARGDRKYKLPNPIKSVAGAMLTIDRIGLSPAVVSALKHVASLPNPEFYEKERNRFWTGKTPRLIRCYLETVGEIHLPRGVRSRVEAIAAEAGTRLAVRETFPEPDAVRYRFSTILRGDQREVVESLGDHDLGVLVAPPGSGKTVMACALIARHSVPTLVIVDRQPLAEQWRERLFEHLGLAKKQVGQIGGQRKATGVIDVAMAQSLARREDLAEVTSQYGLVVVDECHHVPAVTFERAVRQIPVRRWLGLTATPYRRDRLESMMTMYCGPVRHRMAQTEAAQLIHRQLVLHPTAHTAIPGEHIHETFRSLVDDAERTDRICDDAVLASREGRNSLILTRWTGHLESIVVGLEQRGVEPLTLKGGMGKKTRREVVDTLAAPGRRGMVLVATVGLIGEGFDCPALDTVYLAFPVKFRGSVVQHVGRILRPLPGKTDVIVHDYIDVLVPVLARMYQERARGYASLGFEVPKLPRP